MLRKRFPTIVGLLLTALACLSVLSVNPKPIDLQPIPDGREYADAAQRIADGNGFNTTFHGGVPIPSRYAPGFSVALAPFAALKSFPEGVQKGASAATVAYVLAVIIAAWALAGPFAGGFAALLIMFSPFARTSATIVMSDALGAALPVLVVALMRFRTNAADRLSGALLGFATAIRVLGGVTLIAALLVVPDWRSRRRLVLWAAPFIVGVALLQWVTLGSPFHTGYDAWNAGFKEMFRFDAPLRHASPEGFWMFPDRLNPPLIDLIGPPAQTSGTGASNLVFYAAVMFGVVWVYMPPLLPVLGVIYAWRHRTEPAVRYAILAGGLTLAMYLFYGYQAARLIALPASLMLVLTAAGLARCVVWCQRAEVLWRERDAQLAATAGSERPHTEPA